MDSNLTEMAKAWNEELDGAVTRGDAATEAIATDRLANIQALQAQMRNATTAIRHPLISKTTIPGVIAAPVVTEAESLVTGLSNWLNYGTTGREDASKLMDIFSKFQSARGAGNQSELAAVNNELRRFLVDRSPKKLQSRINNQPLDYAQQELADIASRYGAKLGLPAPASAAGAPVTAKVRVRLKNGDTGYIPASSYDPNSTAYTLVQ